MRKIIYLIFIAISLILPSCQFSTAWNKINPMENSGIVSANDTLNVVAVSAWGSEDFTVLSSLNGNVYEQERINADEPIAHICVTDEIALVSIAGDVLVYDVHLRALRKMPVSDVVGCSTFQDELVLWGENWVNISENRIVSSQLLNIVEVKMTAKNDLILLTRDGNLYQIVENQLILIKELDLESALDIYPLLNQIILINTDEKIFELDSNLDNLREVFSLNSGGIIITTYFDTQDYLWIVSTKEIIKFDADSGNSENVSLPVGVKKINDAYFGRKVLLIATNIGVYQLSIP